MTGRRFRSIGCVWALLWVVYFAGSPAFAAGGKPAEKLVNVADTRAMQPGLSMWIADVYNSNLWLYAVVVVLLMGFMGVILGFGFDRLLVMMGLEFGRLDHHE